MIAATRDATDIRVFWRVTVAGADRSFRRHIVRSSLEVGIDPSTNRTSQCVESRSAILHRDRPALEGGSSNTMSTSVHDPHGVTGMCDDGRGRLAAQPRIGPI